MAPPPDRLPGFHPEAFALADRCHPLYNLTTISAVRYIYACELDLCVCLRRADWSDGICGRSCGRQNLRGHGAFVPERLCAILGRQCLHMREAKEMRAGKLVLLLAADHRGMVVRL
ncbi:hypothetical protein [Bradyrhizobium sp. CCBAU 51753]|uniref:hypothetical protein n=1 Tax=Bradyrhizobium sp. CCBAU 51753 TaxID=1325100 RepID=UPI00188CA46F|nr:hypothetical protein [Bradyrhizobium sp. CCBAU 51753]